MRISASRLRRTALALPLAASLGACMTWSRQPVAAPGQDRFFGGAVRVTRVDGSTAYLDSVFLGRDSVMGRTHDAERTLLAMPLSDVRSVEARRGDARGTVAVVVLVAAAALAVLAAMMAAEFGGGA